MKYNQLTTKATRSKVRVGRGISAGQGKTAGRGTKGQKARTGSKRKPGFEGGQNTLMSRFPKLRGFNSHKKPIEVVKTNQLNQLSGSNVNNRALFDQGLTTSEFSKVKIIDGGAVNKKFNVSLQLASKGASAQIKKAGGSFTTIEQVARTKVRSDKTSKK